MTQKFLSKKSLLTMIALGTVSTSAIAAHEMLTPEPVPTEKMASASTGGLILGDPNSPYWFQLSGNIKLDEMAFMGNSISKGNEFRSGANIRNAELDFEGGLGQNISYTLATVYEAKDSKLKVDDAYLTYNINDTFNVSAGQISPAFSLESTASSKWTPFLERSSATHALGIDMGLGLTASKWDKNYTFTVAAMQPRQDHKDKNQNGSNIKAQNNDHWQTSARFAYRPIYDGTKILQLGASGYFYDDHSTGARFKTHAEASARNKTDIIDTGYILAKNHKAGSLELAAQNGPLYAEAEYNRAYVTRAASATPTGKLHFQGYHVTVAYVLTGEARTFKENNATFGQVKPACSSGAWEVAARYSMLNLNNKEVTGGKANNVSLGLNYYINNNVKLSGEYIRSIQTPSTMSTGTPAKPIASNLQKRKLNIVGLRLQAVF